jgi:excisionase family DNA binding protein
MARDIVLSLGKDGKCIMIAQDLLAGAKSAAHYIGVTPRVVYHMVEDGHLPVARVGRKLYFRRSELDRVFSATPSVANDRGRAQ